MPVRAVDRLIVMLVGLLLLAVMFGFIWQALGLEFLDGAPLVLLLAYLAAWSWRTLLTIAVLLGLAAYLFWMGLRRRRVEKTILCDTPLGEVRVAERAIEALAMRATRKVKGVQDAQISLRAAVSGLDIFVDATVGPDLNIPQITQEIGNRVADYIRETVGVSVNSVTVKIPRIAPELRARVE